MFGTFWKISFRNFLKHFGLALDFSAFISSNYKLQMKEIVNTELGGVAEA